MAFMIDITPLIQSFDIPKDRVRAVTEAAVIAATEAVHGRIHEEANRGLRSTRGQYKRGLQRPEYVRSMMGIRGSIALIGILPNMIEQGAAPFDIKAGFAKSSKRKMKVDGGWYMTIPFRHATSGAIGENEAFSSVMPKSVEKQMKSKEAATTTPFGGKVGGGSSMTMNDLYKVGMAGKGTRAAITRAGGDLTSGQRMPYQHKSPIYQGMVREQKTYESATQGQYMTFRRVSDMSAANSWIHKGFEARDFMPKALRHPNVAAETARAIDVELTSVGL